MAAATRAGVTVCGTRSLPGPAAELTWALILALLRQVPESDAGLRAGDGSTPSAPTSPGATLGLLGLGRLGQRVARVGNAFEMDVLAWSQNLDPEAARAQGVTPVGRDELLARSDVVSLHLRLSDRTRGWSGSASWRRCADRVPGEHLARAARRRGGSARRPARRRRSPAPRLDVYDVEPLPGTTRSGRRRTPCSRRNRLRHRRGYRLFYGDAVEDIVAWRDGTPVRVIEP